MRDEYRVRGPEGFSDAELVGLVLGGRNPATTASALLHRLGGLRGVAAAEPGALRGPGVGEASAVRLHAALALTRRLGHPPPPGLPVLCPEDALSWLRPGFAGLDVEELHALYLDRRRRVLACRRLTRGSDGFTVVDPRQVFRPAVQLGASAVVMAHNHPSGDPSPSPQDRDVTQRVAAAGAMLGVPVLDHLVIAGAKHRSLAEDGSLPRFALPGPRWLDGAGRAGTQ